MHDLEDRLRSLDLPAPPLAPRAIAARVERRRHRRRILTTGAAAVLVLATVGSLAVMATGDDDATIAPASAPSEPSPVSSANTIPTPSAETTAAETTPDTTMVDLSGEDGGLYIDPAVATELGLVPDHAGGPVPLDEPDASEQAPFTPDGISSDMQRAVLARYDGTRSLVIDSITVNVLPSTSSLSEMEGEIVTLPNGFEARRQDAWISWSDGIHDISVQHITSSPPSPDASPTVDLLAIARSVTVDADGAIELTTVPDGFERLPSEIAADGTSGSYRSIDYRSNSSLASDRPELSIDVATGAHTAEHLLVERSMIGPARAVEHRGQRIIVSHDGLMSPRPYVELIWDDPSGIQVWVTYSPMELDATEQDREVFAFRVVDALRRADAANWRELQRTADEAHRALVDVAWIDELLGARGFERVGSIAPDWEVLWDRDGLFIVSARSDDGTAADCLIVLRTDVRCVTATDPLRGRFATARVERTVGGRLILLTTPDISGVSLQRFDGGWGRSTIDLSAADDPRELRAVLIEQPSVPACLILSADDHVVVTRYSLVDGALVDPSESCMAQT